ncbi:type IV secretory system conjugative DNA transfer family protein [Photobacterium damselae]|uniref:type IV secretory system conjugative DNA transfer family protein n=1 Tax=Photobacterium damselae TaxID=38293 RepID=UPI001EFD7EDD|nr:type IV secretory system conjugative DNA transfer family protein [Photobacterium damselae]MCG9706493.1 type IV secretory system conjugative DNA transfer family protein [Photobacterium damselae]
MKKLIGGLLFFNIYLIAGSYLAGAIYYSLYDANFDSLTPLTYPTQLFYYATSPLYQKNLAIAGAAPVGIGIIFLCFVIFKEDKKTLFGDARFATSDDIRKYKLTKKDNKDDGLGVLIGRVGKQFIYYMGDAFVFLAAASRTGKGVGVIIPNLLRWTQSVVITDFKLENFYITSKFREKILRQKVYLFSPFAEDGRSHCYNPLNYVRDGHLTIPDIRSQAEMLMPSSTGNDVSKYFALLGQNLMVGLALYIRATPELPFTYGEIERQRQGKGRPLKEHLEDILSSRPDLPDACQSALQSFLSLDPDKGQTGASNTLGTALTDWNNPVFDKATSKCDFDLRDVRKKRMTIYIGITPDYIPVAGRILNLFFSHLINLNTKETPEQNRSLKYQCLLLMDEFTAMGYIPIIGKSNNYFAGYLLRLLTIVQSPSQLEAPQPEGYGKQTADTYLTNHEAKLIYTQEDEDAEKTSRFLGDYDLKIKEITRNEKGRRSVSVRTHKRPLMLPQELREMPFEKMLIKMRGKRPIYCDKILYFKESIFIDRLKQVSPTLAVVKGVPKSKSIMDDVIASGELCCDVPLLEFEAPTSPQPSFNTPMASSQTIPTEPNAALAAFDENEDVQEDNEPINPVF